MRVSEYYKLGRTQPTLDFVDVDIATDVPVFLDPRPIRMMPGHWAQEAQYLLQSFFEEILKALKNNDRRRVGQLMAHLHEPSETHLGFTKRGVGGRGIGSHHGRVLADALAKSEAARTGLLRDLEDTILLVPGVGPDLISDIATNVMRGALIEYTQRMAVLYGIPMEDMPTGPVWNPSSKEWGDGYASLPVVPGGRLLLVPKFLARHKLDYDPQVYYSKYLAPYLEQRELDGRTELVRTLKNGTARVDRSKLRAKYGDGRESIVKWTLEYPSALERFRDLELRRPRKPLTHAEVAQYTGTSRPDFVALYESVKAIAPGNAGATSYHRAVEALLSALFYPALTGVVREQEINEGRKRVDLLYENVAQSGFFDFIGRRITAPFVHVECKNYAGDPANPEYDQLTGRFSRERGHFGLLVCRSVKNKEKMLATCRDAAKDGRGFVVVLDDDDLAELVFIATKSDGDATQELMDFDLIKERFKALAM